MSFIFLLFIYSFAANDYDEIDSIIKEERNEKQLIPKKIFTKLIHKPVKKLFSFIFSQTFVMILVSMFFFSTFVCFEILIYIYILKIKYRYFWC